MIEYILPDGKKLWTINGDKELLANLKEFEKMMKEEQDCLMETV
jgi:hypothetical protein